MTRSSFLKTLASAVVASSMDVLGWSFPKLTHWREVFAAGYTPKVKDGKLIVDESYKSAVYDELLMFRPIVFERLIYKDGSHSKWQWKGGEWVMYPQQADES